MYFIASMVHELMKICLRNSLTYGNPSDETFVSQLFVLTHNDAFFRLIFHGVIDNYERVSIFQVEKKNNISTIKVCEEKKANFSPVKHVYATL